MIDTLLNIGCSFDWITPLIAFIQDLFSGPVSDFGIPVNSYWGRREIMQLLEYYQVHVWGIMFNFTGEIMLFTVQRKQAALTYYLLQQEGIPILYAPNIQDLDFLTPFQ